MVSAPEPAALLQQFRAVQQLRAQLYSQFSEGFIAFLKSRDGHKYRSLLAKLTAEFQNCSATVRLLESALMQASRPDLAAVLRSIQELERQKLQLTLQLQVSKALSPILLFQELWLLALWPVRASQNAGSVKLLGQAYWDSLERLMSVQALRQVDPDTLDQGQIGAAVAGELRSNKYACS